MCSSQSALFVNIKLAKSLSRLRSRRSIVPCPWDCRGYYPRIRRRCNINVKDCISFSTKFVHHPRETIPSACKLKFNPQPPPLRSSMIFHRLSVWLTCILLTNLLAHASLCFQLMFLVWWFKRQVPLGEKRICGCPIPITDCRSGCWSSETMHCRKFPTNVAISSALTSYQKLDSSFAVVRSNLYWSFNFGRWKNCNTSSISNFRSHYMKLFPARAFH